MSSINSQGNQKHMQDAIDLLERFLPLKKWGFKQSVQFFDNTIFPVVIYDSKMCRMKAFYEVPDRRLDHRITIHYGRLDTQNDVGGLRVKSRENFHLYWHSIRLPLDFLDGLSPHDAIAAKDPRLIREFELSDKAKNISYQPEKILAMHATIWDTCGQKLFDIFDTRNSDLWERYSNFVKEFWEALSHP